MKLNLNYESDNIYNRVRSRLNAFQVHGHKFHTRLPFQQVYSVSPKKMDAIRDRDMVVWELDVFILPEKCAPGNLVGYSIIQATNGWLYVQRVGNSSEKFCHTTYRRFGNMTVEELLSYLWCESQDYITPYRFVLH